MSSETSQSNQTRTTRPEQNDTNGAPLTFVKQDLQCGGLHQLSIWQPTVIIDSHMHIQSGRCSTAQFVRYQGPLAPVQTGFEFSRGAIEGAGTVFGGLLTLFEWVIMKPAKQIAQAFSKPAAPDNPQEGYFSKNAVLELVTMQENSTGDVAELFISERTSLMNNYFKNSTLCPLYKNAPHLFFSSVVMTMDMEYAHIDGYFGLKIYNPLFEKNKPMDSTRPARYWTPAHGKWTESADIDFGGNPIIIQTFSKFRNKTVYQKTGESAKITVIDDLEEFKGYKKGAKAEGTIIGACLDPVGDLARPVPVRIEALPVLMSESEGKKYENWEKQVKQTEEAAIKYPLKFLPMYHYDPRRWQLKGANAIADLVTRTVTGANSLYLGFKMYTAQGYRPWDVRRLPSMKEFYYLCCRQGIPILNHCTPGGARTYEDEEYFDFEHPFDNEAEERTQREGCGKSDYFEKHFVSPEAWKKVLDGGMEREDYSFRNLQLCLAHFGGPSKTGMEWNRQIINMIVSRRYPNLYTDISSSFADSGFRKDFKKIMQGAEGKILRKHILFGTDWYMTFGYGVFNKKNLWDYCTETKEFLDSFDTSLWPYFTQYNPYQFYRLDFAVPRIAESIINIMKKEDYESVMEGQQPKYKVTATEVEKEAAWVRAANRDHTVYEETPWKPLNTSS